MQTITARNDNLILESVVSSGTGLQRLAVGLLQGIVLYFLYQATKSSSWPATERLLFAPLLLVALVAPVLLISSLGHLDRRRTTLWTLVSVFIIAGLGFYDVWRGDASWAIMGVGEDALRTRYPSPLLFVFLVAGFFIAHSLVLSAAADHRRIARYATHFETAWKLLIHHRC